jgi:hypothetical protein
MEMKMKKSTLFSLIPLLLLALGSAFAQDVRFNFDKDADFSKFKSYKWVALKDATKVDDILDKDIKDAFEAQLAARGLTKVDSDPADLYVGYQAAVAQEKQFSSYSTDWGYGGGWYRGGWYGPSNTTTTGQTETIYIGQLALDMYDSNDHKLVWRGLASKTIDKKAKPEKQQKNLTKAATKLLKNYPPVKKS